MVMKPEATKMELAEPAIDPEVVDSDIGAEEQETTDEPKEGVSEEEFVPKTDDDGEEEGLESSDQDDTESEDDDGEIDDLLDEKVDGKLKRINKLTAQKKVAEEEAARYRAELDALRDEKAKPKSDLPSYTKAQLAQATRKAMEEQDYNLLNEIQEYRDAKLKEDIRQEYIAEQRKATEAQARVSKEWTSVMEDYAYLSDKAEQELYPGSQNDLDINNAQSLLRQLAARLFFSPDPVIRAKYQRDGGQRAAVVDALTRILKKKRTAGSSKEIKKLKKRVAKEKRKSSLASGSSVKAEKTAPSRPKNEFDKLKDYISERKKVQYKARGGI